MKIMIVDDHARMRETIKQLLSDLTEDIVEVADGADAIAASAIHQPDWTLMDIEMKEMDGIEATRKIMASCPEARILILTSFDDDYMRAAALAAGAFGFILKDNLTEVVRFLREFPSSPSPLATNRDQAFTVSSVRGLAAVGGFADDGSIVLGSATVAEPFDVMDEVALAWMAPATDPSESQSTSDIWAASCRDCANHALKKLDGLQHASQHIRKAVRSIRRSLEPALWSDERHLDPIKGRHAFVEWRYAVKALRQIPADFSNEPAGDARTVLAKEEAMMDLIQGAVLLIAQTVQWASGYLGAVNPQQREHMEEELAKAQEEIAQAETRLAERAYDLAMLDYGKAWLHATYAASSCSRAKK